MSQGIIEGRDGRVGEAVEGRIGVEIGSESDERVGVGIDESLDEGLEEIFSLIGTIWILLTTLFDVECAVVHVFENEQQ